MSNWLICIDDRSSCITKGKQYDCKNHNTTCYSIKDDTGRPTLVLKNWFITLDEYRISQPQVIVE